MSRHLITSYGHRHDAVRSGGGGGVPHCCRRRKGKLPADLAALHADRGPRGACVQRTCSASPRSASGRCRLSGRGPERAWPAPPSHQSSPHM
eukprot:CAMPEP_0180120348 /NCGR_PEP_ID=MMETSP0986-20121125/2470_1 /TAXON_ID=697907 /ORGANISM="non described non described, Strain CCMP2293" /LENGTH=91 /DNA_ID=CAMNT_0022059415 /DNA_START=111 /DNA_END=386 /DNA_ORIENTATION=+